jgi:hypothetical protein
MIQWLLDWGCLPLFHQILMMGHKIIQGHHDDPLGWTTVYPVQFLDLTLGSISVKCLSHPFPRQLSTFLVNYPLFLIS